MPLLARLICLPLIAALWVAFVLLALAVACEELWRFIRKPK